MSGERETGIVVRCACGQVEFHVRGAPLASVVCYCDDCQAGAGPIEALPGARLSLAR